MRTTLTIDDDVLSAIKDRATAEGRTAGEVASELMRTALVGEPRSDDAYRTRNGFPLIPDARNIVTPEMVERIRDIEGV